MRIVPFLYIPLLGLASACSDDTSSDNTVGASNNALVKEVGVGDGALLFDSTRVAEIYLEIADSDIAILEEEKTLPLGSTDFTYVRATLTFDGNSLGTVGIRVKGNSSRSSAAGLAMPYKIDTNRFVETTKLDGEKKFNLHLAQGDNALNDYLSYAAWREFDVAASRTGWAELTINGERVAVYTTVEQANKGLLDEYFDDGEGALYKPESPAGNLTYSGTAIDDYATSTTRAMTTPTMHPSFLSSTYSTMNPSPSGRTSWM